MSEGSGSKRSRGGVARAASLSAAERKAIASKAAVERWHSEIPQATHEGILQIGDLALQCAVVDGGQRLLSENSVLQAFGLHPSGSTLKRATLSEDQSVRLPMFVGGVMLRPFIGNDLMNLLTKPIMYRRQGGGRPGRGLDATLVPKVCEVWIKARDAGVLKSNQLKVADRAWTLLRALADTGIIALVDEATGYQEVRDKLALQAILNAYLSRELAAWANRFPSEFYQQIFRLRGWAWDELKEASGKGQQGPRVVGKYTNDFVYSRLAPGILDELQKLNPVNPSGQRRAKHHQWLTDDVGHPALAQHLHAVIGLMRVADSWEHFQVMLNKAFPRKTKIDDLPLFSKQKALKAADAA